ncbi:ferredoxin reductase family protein [Desulfohalovibrio reitneri]|uniref:ferredoxin reductase family protein n=1 Tax=Desulfohalovibrio reitneri TaxID=1307759 RepID=UPI0004A6DCD9|nr:ferredoxin reductase family protein [Desulfohalovibrio reitneri]
MTRGTALILVYILLAVLPATLAVFLVEQPYPIFLRELAKMLALTGAAILMLQPVLAARFHFIERPFGLDMVLRFHRNMAVLALAMLLAHPVLIALSGAGWRLLYSLDLPWYIWTGKIALALLVLNGLASLLFSRLPLSWENWRLVHDLLGPAILLLVVLHAPILGADFNETPQQAVAWLVFLTAAGVFVWHRFVRPSRLRSRPWSVTSVTEETPDVYTVEVSPPNGDAPQPHDPGQFQFVTFLRDRGLPREEHHWTISSSPERPNARACTIKKSGDFTATIDQIRIGDKAMVHGPFGRFSHVHHQGEKLAFVAGGIGITPLMSMLRAMRDRGERRDVVLLYANKTLHDAVFAEELAAMAGDGQQPSLELVHVLSRPDKGWDGESGRIDADMLRRRVTDHAERRWFLCGPKGMVDAFVPALRAMGVPDSNMHREIFTFLD